MVQNLGGGLRFRTVVVRWLRKINIGGVEMEQFTVSVRKSLKEKNWNAALFIALTLPDICSRLEADDNKANGERYALWFDKYLKKVNTMSFGAVHHVFMTGDDCYVLRCSMLHQGFSDVSHQRRKGVLDRFYFTSMAMHRIQISNMLHLNVEQFCLEMVSAVEEWFDDFLSSHPDKHHRLADMLIIHESSYSVGPVMFGGEGDKSA